MTTMRIVGHRVEGARRRIPFQALFAEARAPQGSGPFCFAFLVFSACGDRAAGHRLLFHNLLRGLAGHDTGAVTPPVVQTTTISGVPSPHRQKTAAWTAWRDVQGIAIPPVQRCRRGARRPRVAHRARAQPKWRALFSSLIHAPVTELAYVSALEAEFWEFDSPLGHQLFFAGCTVNLVDGLHWTQEAAGSNPATQTSVFRLVRLAVRTPDFHSGDRGFESRTGRHIHHSRVSSMDQSTCLRSKGLHVRVVHVGPVSGACSAGTPGCGSKATMQRIANPQTPV